ncbi:Cysteine-rich secretory protein family [Phytophthora infestans]|uniref:Cysteine-rich secretory protein family n=1 Tax=Phytophthora infestans TaxID=4787 RepID=A0A833ST86_PHYIN|nr:Cysteine-rich secretory protein family [Phytophthora infestans]KAF4139878.1 Cysteine-rich secretory protein family [Phytophthora infestans]
MINIAQSSLALLLIVAAASSTGASYLRKLGGTTIATNVKTYAAYDDYAPAMLAAVNKQRATKGLSPLCLNNKLHTAAQRHSDDMAIKTTWPTTARTARPCRSESRRPDTSGAPWLRTWLPVRWMWTP